MRRDRHVNEPHDVYWLLGADNRVLYIGCSHRLPERLVNHARGKEWWPQVARIEVETFADKASARTREAEAIRAELPTFNKHVPRVAPILPPIIHRDQAPDAAEATR